MSPNNMQENDALVSRRRMLQQVGGIGAAGIGVSAIAGAVSAQNAENCKGFPIPQTGGRAEIELCVVDDGGDVGGSYGVTVLGNKAIEEEFVFRGGKVERSVLFPASEIPIIGDQLPWNQIRLRLTLDGGDSVSVEFKGCNIGIFGTDCTDWIYLGDVDV